jgi:anti-sigma factor RsiW
MTRPSGAHLSSDEIDACLSGVPSLEVQQHLDQCSACLEQVRVDREIAELITALPPMGPTEGFTDRVMARVAIPDPFALRSLQATRRRLFATPKSLAVAASLLIVLIGSMAGSVAWSLANQDTLASLGKWLFAQGGQAIWLGVQGVTTNLIEQPWYAGFRSLVETPGRLAAYSAIGSLLYLGGLLALRRLLAAPTQQVAHVAL